jgi:hypothetical protein
LKSHSIDMDTPYSYLQSLLRTHVRTLTSNSTFERLNQQILEISEINTLSKDTSPSMESIAPVKNTLFTNHASIFSIFLVKLL